MIMKQISVNVNVVVERLLNPNINDSDLIYFCCCYFVCMCYFVFYHCVQDPIKATRMKFNP